VARMTPNEARSAARRRALVARTAKTMSVVDQIWYATRADNLLGTLLGCVLGGLVPLLSYVEAHHDTSTYAPLRWALVGGGLVFSCATVWHWGSKAFESAYKAAGFVLLLEGAMVFSGVTWLGQVALGLLMAVNAIATGVALALQKWRPGRQAGRK